MDQPIKKVVFFNHQTKRLPATVASSSDSVGYKCDALTETPQIRIEQPPAGQADFDFLNVCNISRQQAIR